MKQAIYIFMLLFTVTSLKAQSGIQELKDKAAFETAIANNEKVVMVFAAEWSDYCKDFLPKVDGIAANYEKIKFFKINYDENIGLFQAEGIEMTPTTKLYKNGVKVDEMVVLEVLPLQEKLQDF